MLIINKFNTRTASGHGKTKAQNRENHGQGNTMIKLTTGVSGIRPGSFTTQTPHLDQQPANSD